MGVGAASLDHEDVQAVADVAEALAIGLDHRDIVAVPCQQLSDIGTDFAGPDDDHSHQLIGTTRPG